MYNIQYILPSPALGQDCTQPYRCSEPCNKTEQEFRALGTRASGSALLLNAQGLGRWSVETRAWGQARHSLYQLLLSFEHCGLEQAALRELRVWDIGEQISQPVRHRAITIHT